MTMRNVVIFDIESCTWNFKADKGFLLCVGYKYLGDKKITVLTREFPDDPFNDKKLCKEIYDVLSKAEGLITHNGKRFDVPFLNTRFLLNGLPVLPPALRHFDTCETIFKKLKMGASLKNSIEEFGLPSEKTALSLKGSLQAVYGDKKQYKWIVDHCRKDVQATEKLYEKLKALGAPGWSMAALADRPSSCPVCGESGGLQRRGWNKAIKRQTPRYQCQNCGGWSSGKSQPIPE